METTRRTFLASMAAASIARPKAHAAAPAPQATHHIDTSKRPRNVVLFICDDLGYGDLGCYGSHLPTPNLDRLAAEGIRFTHFNSAHPICSAARAAVMTGRYGTRSGARGAFMPHSPTGLALDETTLGNLFHQRGFATKAIGKWHLGDAPEYLPTNRGFDSYYGVPYSVDMYPLPLIRDTEALEEDTDRTLLTPRYTEEALKFLDEQHAHPDKPFFLYFAFSYPHDPARSSPRFHNKSGFGEQGDAIAELDWSVGQVVESLRAKGLLEDTLVLFTSDHGPWFQGCPGFLRGRKGSTFEGGCRVPLIAHWPAAIRAGQVSNVWMSNLDLLPTLASLCGLPLPPRPLDGIDMKQALPGSPEEPTRKALLHFSPQSAHGMDFHCARKGDWKARFAQLGEGGEIYINDHGPANRSYWLPHPELYNLRTDPAEAYDVAALHPEIVADILHDAEAQMQTMPAPVLQAFNDLRQSPASITTPPGAAGRIPTTQPLPAWAWEPPDRR